MELLIKITSFLTDTTEFAHLLSIIGYWAIQFNDFGCIGREKSEIRDNNYKTKQKGHSLV